jgi:hypothetical protein
MPPMMPVMTITMIISTSVKPRCENHGLFALFLVPCILILFIMDSANNGCECLPAPPADYPGR